MSIYQLADLRLELESELGGRDYLLKQIKEREEKIAALISKIDEVSAAIAKEPNEV